MKVYLQKNGKSYYAKFRRPDTGKWSNWPLRTTKKAVAKTRLGEAAKEIEHEYSFPPEERTQPLTVGDLVKKFRGFIVDNQSASWSKIQECYFSKI